MSGLEAAKWVNEFLWGLSPWSIGSIVWLVLGLYMLTIPRHRVVIEDRREK